VLIGLIGVAIVWGGCYGLFTFFSGGDSTVKAIVDNTILVHENSKARSFKIGKGMTKVEPLTELDFQQNNGQLFANAEYLSMGAMNMSYISKTSWSIPLVIFFFSGLMFMFMHFKSPDLVALYGGAGVSLFTGLWFAYLVKVKYTESIYQFIRFERQTGLVIFPIGNGEKHFSVSIDDVELYTSKVSSGKGVMHRVAFLAPKKFPKTMWWQKLYTVNFRPRTPISAQTLWTEVNHYMDKSRPIPKAFYRNWQDLMDDTESSMEEKKSMLTAKLFEQAPFYDRKNNTYLDKEFW